MFKYGYAIGVPIKTLLVHDLSKFLPIEWFPYVDNFFGPKKHPEAFKEAWRHHYEHNTHHWEYWGNTYPVDMPDECIVEMVADWAAAGRGITGRWENPYVWYKKQGDRIPVSHHVDIAVETYSGILNARYGNNT